MKSFRATLQISIILLFIGVFASNSLIAHPLTLEQRQRLKEYLPRTFPKLEAREPVHVVALGDSVMLGYTPLPSAWQVNNSLFTYPGVFLGKIGREFFYTGGVKLLNPPKGGSSNLSQYMGNQISFENLSTMDAVMLSGIQRTTTDAFVHRPDLLLIQYGVNDALLGTSLDVYKRALYETIEAGKAHKTDMIVFSPTLVNEGGGAMKWGITRPYASVAKEVCEAEGVMFIDLGQHLMKWGGSGIDPSTHPESAMAVLGDTLTSKIFRFGPDLETKEVVHPCLKAHQGIAHKAFEELLNGPPVSDFTMAGVASYSELGEISVRVSLRNQTKEEKKGTIGALAIGKGLVPVEPSQRFEIPAGKNAQIVFHYRRTVVGKNRDGGVLYYPLEIDDNVNRFSFVLEDTFSSEIIDLPLRVGPISVSWQTKLFVDVKDQLRLKWTLINGTDKPVSGQYQIGLGSTAADLVEFTIPPLGNKPYFAAFAFDGDAEGLKFQKDIWIEIRSEGKVVRFDRELEATKDLVLDEAVPMSSWVSYENADPAGSKGSVPRRSGGRVDARFEMDEKFLRVFCNMRGIAIPDLGKRAALRAVLSIDARPSNEVQGFGFINPIEILTRGSDSNGFTMPVELGSFGSGYDKILDSRGISSQLKTATSGDRVLEIRIPKRYFHRINWKKVTAGSLVGVKLEVTPATADANPANPFDLKNSYSTNSSTFNFQNETIRGVGSKDPRGLSVLRLSKEPVSTWSVRLY